MTIFGSCFIPYIVYKYQKLYAMFTIYRIGFCPGTKIYPGYIVGRYTAENRAHARNGTIIFVHLFLERFWSRWQYSWNGTKSYLTDVPLSRPQNSRRDRIRDYHHIVAFLPCHLSSGSSMVRASHRRSEILRAGSGLLLRKSVFLFKTEIIYTVTRPKYAALRLYFNERLWQETSATRLPIYFGNYHL